LNATSTKKEKDIVLSIYLFREIECQEKTNENLPKIYKRFYALWRSIDDKLESLLILDKAGLGEIHSDSTSDQGILGEMVFE